MKKLYLLLLATFTIFITTDLSAQSHAIGAEVGPEIILRSGGDLWLRIGGVYQYDFNEIHSIKASVDYGLDFGTGSAGLFLVAPEYRYAFNETFDGLYAGGYFKYGAVLRSGGGSYFGFGGTVGYELPISDSFVLDLNGQLGYASLGFSSGIPGFSARIGGLGLGFAVIGKFLL